MESPFPQSNPSSGDYNRPNQKWLCGRACDGGPPCPAGPDQRGLCRAGTECRPARRGDRWFCTRSEALGGACADGPLPAGGCCRPIAPCRPRRGLRVWRGMTALLAVALSCVWLVFKLTQKGGEEYFSPGELSFSHSAPPGGCAGCHAGMTDLPLNWLDRVHQSPRADSHKCLDCHNVGDHPFDPHSRSAADLATVTDRIRGGNESAPVVPATLKLGGVLASRQPPAAQSLECATCHLEHKGKGHDLRQMTNQQCQGCHGRQFTSLAHGHPGFGEYPFMRRTRIIFDHVSHLRQHFHDPARQAAAPAGCQDCHTPDQRGQGMLTRSFEQTCAACHDGQIRGEGRAGSMGVPVLRVPGLDLEALDEKNLPLGSWPEFAEGRLTPFMELLLADDAEVAVALEKLKGKDWLDLLDADDATLQAAHRVGWAVKQLFWDLATKGHEEWRRRKGFALKQAARPDELAALLGLFSAEVTEGAVRHWFPNLADDLAKRQAGQKPAKAGPPPAPMFKSGVKPEDRVSHGGWYRSDNDYAIYYRPHGHADGFMAGWMNLTVDPERFTRPAAATRTFDEVAGSKSPGMCTKCHSIDATPAPHVNWRAQRHTVLEHAFTKFSHSAHFSLLDSRGCQTCHSIDQGEPVSAYAASFEKGNRDPAMFKSNFKSIQKDFCASCHTRQFAGDGCLLCHKYHVGHFAPTLTDAKLDKPGKKAKSKQP